MGFRLAVGIRPVRCPVDEFEATVRVTVVRAVRVKAPRPGSRAAEGGAWEGRVGVSEGMAGVWLGRLNPPIN